MSICSRVWSFPILCNSVPGAVESSPTQDVVSPQVEGFSHSNVVTAHSETFWRASAGTFLSVGFVGPSFGKLEGSINLDGGVCEDLVSDGGWIVG